MLDGKCTTILSKETNCYASCPICGIKAAEMKDKEKIEAYKKKVKPENLKYCLSTLHCWIRSAEFLLHLGYKSKVKTWQIKKTLLSMIWYKQEKVRSRMNFTRSLASRLTSQELMELEIVTTETVQGHSSRTTNKCLRF